MLVPLCILLCEIKRSLLKLFNPDFRLNFAKSDSKMEEKKFGIDKKISDSAVDESSEKSLTPAPPSGPEKNRVDSTTPETLNQRLSQEISMYGWGKNDYGQLGLGSENMLISCPSPIDANQSVISIASGLRHTVYLTSTRKVYSCGSNEFGQLGQQKSQCRPSLVSGFGSEEIFHVAAGDHFSLAIAESGVLFGWGSSKNGELMCKTDSIHEPKLLDKIMHWSIVQVACGAQHCIALTEEGTILAWGSNAQGQLGLGSSQLEFLEPTIIASMSAFPVSQVCAGAYHSGVLSPSGTLFTWGKNNWGQLGHGNSETNQSSPRLVKTLRHQEVVFVAMGEEHSVCRTRNGGVFSWGHGGNGQLGHNSMTNVTQPKKIMELMGTTVCQICCGRRHTISLTDKRKLLGFGLNSNKQLGSISDTSVRLPVSIPISLADDRQLSCIAAGGDQSFSGSQNESSCLLSPEYLMSAGFKQPRKYSSKLAAVFNTLENRKLPESAQRELAAIFSSPASLNASFLGDNHWATNSKNPGLSLSKCSTALVQLFRHGQSREIIIHSIKNKLILALPKVPPDIETLRLHLTIPIVLHFAKQYKEQFSDDFTSCVVSFARKSNALQENGEKVLKSWLSSLGQLYFSRILNVIKSDIEAYLQKTPASDYSKTDNLKVLCIYLKRLYEVNEAEKILSSDQFYIRGLNQNGPQLFEDYKNWRMSKVHCQNGTPVEKFSFCQFPFVYDAQAKSILMRIDSQIHQLQKANMTRQRNLNNIAQNILTGQAHLRSEMVVLNVSRDKILSDTIYQIMHQIFQSSEGPKALHKPLIVQFKGEEARDANIQNEAGVRREFFMLLIEAILDPCYGMVKEDDESNLVWFRSTAGVFDEDEGFNQEFFLFGIVCALAIYNDNIVDIHFPFALYKKLLGEKPNLTDLKELHPSVGNSMDRILSATEEDCLEDWGLYFSVEQTEFDMTTEIDLIPGGREIAVNYDNRKDYVETYIDFIFNVSVKTKFENFRKGFNALMEDNQIFNMFRPEELQKIIVGATVVDWRGIESGAKYHDGYQAGHPTIKVFWAAFHQLSEEEKRKFLIFLTGSSRVPLAGLTVNLKKVAVSVDHLPVAHTCFNLLDLPPYTDVTKTVQKLRQALQIQSGFQLV